METVLYEKQNAASSLSEDAAYIFFGIADYYTL